MPKAKPEPLVKCGSKRKLNRYLDGIVKKLGPDAAVSMQSEAVNLDGDRAWSVTYRDKDGAELMRTVVKFNRSKGVVFIPASAVKG